MMFKRDEPVEFHKLSLFRVNFYICTYIYGIQNFWDGKELCFNQGNYFYLVLFLGYQGKNCALRKCIVCIENLPTHPIFWLFAPCLLYTRYTVIKAKKQTMRDPKPPHFPLAQTGLQKLECPHWASDTVEGKRFQRQL